MGAGGSLQIFYKLPGPLPAGGYAISANGVNTAADVKLHADLIYRPAVGAELVLGSLDSTPQAASFHLQPWIQGTVCGGAVAAQAGDALVLKFTNAGSKDFSVLETSMTIP